jgi:hypothetical protein
MTKSMLVGACSTLSGRKTTRIWTARSNLPPRTELGLAISNPSFELWLILHYREHAAFIDTRCAERESKLLDGRPGKHIDAGTYLPRRFAAARRAELLATQHDGDGNQFPHNNPSSAIYELLRALEADQSISDRPDG